MGNFILKKYILIFLLLGSLGECFALAASTSKIPSVVLDAHMHFPEPGSAKKMPETYSDFQFGLLISPSFKISKSAHIFMEEDEWKKDFSMRKKLNRQVSDYIQKFPTKFAGACGINLEWTDAREILEHCLNLPGMSGVKIHSELSQANLSNGGYNDLLELLQSQKNKVKFVIWHLKTDFFEEAENELELNLALKVINAFPKIGFILAHTLYWPEGLNIIHKWLKKFNLANLYIDMSTNLDPEEGILIGYFSKAWQRFDFSRMLFGSDLWLEHIEDQKNMIDAVYYSPLLTKKEKEQLLFENPKTFLEKYKLQIVENRQTLKFNRK